MSCWFLTWPTLCSFLTHPVVILCPCGLAEVPRDLAVVCSRSDALRLVRRNLFQEWVAAPTTHFSVSSPILPRLSQSRSRARSLEIDTLFSLEMCHHATRAVFRSSALDTRLPEGCCVDVDNKKICWFMHLLDRLCCARPVCAGQPSSIPTRDFIHRHCTALHCTTAPAQL
jgi:hypothetical protein